MTEAGFRVREGTSADLPAVGTMYTGLDSFFRQLSYHFPVVDEVGAVWAESFRRTLGRFSVLFIAERGEERLGFVMGRIKRTAPYLGGVLVGELSDLWVEPTARRQGVAEALAQRLLDWMRAQGVHSVEVQVLEGNGPSQALFEAVGFRPELRQLRYLWQEETAGDA